PVLLHVDYFQSGPMCNTTWDGWLCWEHTEPGVKRQNCPDYFHDFDTQEGNLCLDLLK
uniref:G-protein coupled receptors family 2 profile 1 domain-containing protein n=1 Tax=Cyprinodon variegatus TaxID=28743 RepID=A0A3Q2CS65_CYPVA